MIQHLEIDCENVFRTSKHWRKASNLQKVCEDASCWKRVSIGMCYKTSADVDDGFGDRTPACREYTHFRAGSDSRVCAAIPGRTVIGPVIEVHVTQVLGTVGIESQIPSTTTQGRTSWVVICRGKKRYVEELHFRDPGHNPTSSELLLERSIAKEGEPCSAEMEQSRIEETHAMQSEISMDTVYYPKEVILVGERKWNDIPAYKSFKGDSLQAEISKLVRHYYQDERETDLLIGIPWVQNWGNHFRSPEGENSRTRIGFNTFTKAATR